MIGINIQGAKEIEAKLRSLEKNTQKKIIRKAVREGSRPTLNAAKANAKALVGGRMGSLLSKHIVLRAWKKQWPGQYRMWVGMRSDVPEFVSNTKVSQFALYLSGKRGNRKRALAKRHYIPSAIEYGHAFPGRGGYKGAPKDVPAIPFMRTAFDSTKRRAAKLIEREALNRIYQYARYGRMF